MKMPLYRGYQLSPNSEAYEMWEKKEFKKLDQHLKMLEQKERDLVARYSKEKQ